MAVGESEDGVRSALAELEDEGLAYRSIVATDAWCLTVEGRERR